MPVFHSSTYLRFATHFKDFSSSYCSLLVIRKSERSGKQNAVEERRRTFLDLIHLQALGPRTLQHLRICHRTRNTAWLDLALYSVVIHYRVTSLAGSYPLWHHYFVSEIRVVFSEKNDFMLGNTWRHNQSLPVRADNSVIFKYRIYQRQITEYVLVRIITIEIQD